MGRPPSLEEGLVGRKNDLKEIKGAFKKKKAVILAGGAGSGKSRLAVEHTYRSKARGFWTPAGADVQQTLIALAPSFDIPTQGLSEADIAAAVRRRLADLPDKTLWAVDNLPSLDQFTALHEAAGPIRLLVTTRDSRKPLLSGTATLKKVGVLEPAAAVALLCSRDGCKRDEPVAAEIAQEVGYLPLALEILAIRLAREGQTARALLEELRSAPDQASVDAFQSAAGTTIDGAEGVLATLSGALDSLDGETRGRLAPFGYVADAPIPKPLAMALADADDGRFADFLEECASQSLVAASEGFMEIHGLTIAAIRATNVGGADRRGRRSRGAFQGSQPSTRATRQRCERRWLITMRCWSRRAPRRHRTKARFPRSRTIWLSRMGRSAVSSRRSLCSSKPSWTWSGSAAPSTLTPSGAATTLPIRTGRRGASRRRSRSTNRPSRLWNGSSAASTPTPSAAATTSPPRTRRLAGPTMRSRFSSRPSPPANGSSAPSTPRPSRVATTSPTRTRRRAGPERRSRCTSRPWRPASGSWGPSRPDTLGSRNNLANAYGTAGRVEEAIRLHEQTLEAMERILDPEHPDTLRSRNNLANAYRAAGRHAEAIALHERTLRDSERLLGPEHPDALTSRHNLAIAYRAAGRDEEAERLESGAGI